MLQKSGRSVKRQDTIKLKAAFIFLVGDADEKTYAVLSTPSIDLHMIGGKNHEEAVTAARRYADNGVTSIELCAGFKNIGIAQIRKW